MAKWNVDPAHTTVTFSVRHLMITNVRGEFQKVSGSVDFDPATPAAAKVEGEAEIASISTREPQRDTHLKSADFFDAEKWPTMRFVSREVRAGKGGDLELVGDLTIRDVTKPLTLHVSDVTGEQKDPWGNQRIGAHARGSIKRSDFGMKWNMLLEGGGLTVGDEIKLEIDASLVKQA